MTPEEKAKVEALAGRMNWEQIREEIGAKLHTSLQGLVEGTANDLRTFGITIAQNMVGAMKEPEATREALMTELKGQARTLAEINRLRVNAASWKMVDQVLDVVVSVGSRLLFGAAVAV